MKPTTYAPVEAPRHDTNEIARDLIEARYSYDREGFASTLAFVSARQHELAAEYLDWRYGREGASVRADLGDFERWRFGGELFTAAHGVLLCAVLCRAYPDDPKSRLLALPKRDEAGRVTSPEKLAKGMRMPHAPGKRAWAERSTELYRQAQEIAEREPGADVEVIE